MPDPYVYKNTTILKNKLAIKDQSFLDRVESLLVTENETTLPEIDLSKPEAFKQIHKHLFEDLYDWAGAYRTVEISKGDTPFAYADFIPSEMNKIWKSVNNVLADKSQNIENFSKDAAHIISEINAIHPFREGNGRTMRSFIKVLSAEKGFKLSIEGMSRQNWMNASIEAFYSSNDKLEALIKDNLSQNKDKTKSR